MHVLAMRIEVHLPDVRSLKAKRSVLRPVLDGLHNRHAVRAAEVAGQDRWQRAAIGVVAVSGSVRVVTEIIDDAERFVWSFPEIQVLEVERSWMEMDR